MSQHEEDSRASSFGEKLRELREARAMSRERLAEAAGLAADTIGKIERDEVSPALLTMRKLAQGLGIKTLSELFADL